MLSSQPSARPHAHHLLEQNTQQHSQVRVNLIMINSLARGLYPHTASLFQPIFLVRPQCSSSVSQPIVSHSCRHTHAHPHNFSSPLLPLLIHCSSPLEKKHKKNSLRKTQRENYWKQSNQAIKLFCITQGQHYSSYDPRILSAKTPADS